MPIILELRRLRQADHEFEVSLSCMERPYLKKTKTKNTITNLPKISTCMITSVIILI
jgi:hypothetical protein